jgi:DNA-binding GntR family transcriptional regulator
MRFENGGSGVIEAGDGQLTESLYETLRLAIITCELPPGTELSEGYLAARYGMSKAPVRTALSRLGQDGWVRSKPRSGRVVTPITLEDVADIFTMREIVETESAGLAAGRVPEALLRRLNRACANPYRLSDTVAKRRFLLANRDFHVAIAKASGSGRLAASVTRLHDESLRVLYLTASKDELSDDWSRGHGPMIDAIVAGDGKAARRTTLEGIRRSREAVLRALEENPALLSDKPIRHPVGSMAG